MLRRSVVTDGTATGQGKRLSVSLFSTGGILKDRPISISILININSLYFLLLLFRNTEGTSNKTQIII